MPTLIAMIVAALLGWGFDALVGDSLGTGLGFFLNFALCTVVFYAARGWLARLRDG